MRRTRDGGRDDLVLFVIAQNVAHSGGGTRPQDRLASQRLGRYRVRLTAGFQVSINGQSWVSPRARHSGKASALDVNSVGARKWVKNSKR